MNITVDDTSPHWTYERRDLDVTCYGVNDSATGWFQLANSGNATLFENAFNRTATWTNNNATTASIIFQGTAFYLYTIPLGQSGAFSVSLDSDGTTGMGTIFFQSSDPPTSRLSYWRTDLDPSVKHRLSIGLSGLGIFGIDYVNITSPPPSVFPPEDPVGFTFASLSRTIPPCVTSTTTLSTPTPGSTDTDIITGGTPTSTPTPSGTGILVQSNATQTILVGTIVGGILAAIVAAFLVLCLRQRRKRNKKEPRDLLLKPPTPPPRLSRTRISLGLWPQFVRESGSAITSARIPRFRRSYSPVIEPWNPPPDRIQSVFSPRTVDMTTDKVAVGGNDATDEEFEEPKFGAEPVRQSSLSSQFVGNMFNDVKSDSGTTSLGHLFEEPDDEDLAAIKDMLIKYSGLRYDDPYESGTEEQARTPLLSPIESSHTSHHYQSANMRNLDLKRVTQDSLQSLRSLLPRSRASGGPSSGRRTPRRHSSFPNIQSSHASYVQLNEIETHPMPVPDLTFAYAAKRAEVPPGSPKPRSERDSSRWDGNTVVQDGEDPKIAKVLTKVGDMKSSPQFIPEDIKLGDERELEIGEVTLPMPPAPAMKPTGSPPIPLSPPTTISRRTHVKRPSFGPRLVKAPIHRRGFSDSTAESTTDSSVTRFGSMSEEC